ncbi:hypothetical protein [Duganella phyllosphaerae]|uniref:Uncharacterized protein n=1 Tax=Duganella phyllosphaerae TaxID=762836 RepID=A0A1E7W4P1_9BURK|nr:hypothetical protein [Duganella phyllosphaerae]OEZ90702.1 hypothetical protein DUPY_53090 [Duganella phyllosphaerae]
MNHQELLLAAEVAKICRKIQNMDKTKYAETIEHEPNREELLEKWIAEHPTSSFVPKAYAFLKKVAAEITRIESDIIDSRL